MIKRHRLRFRTLTIVQIVFLVVSAIGLSWSILSAEYVTVPLIISIVILLQALVLIRYTESHVDALEEFFAAVNFEDFTRRFIEKDVDSDLKTAFNQIISKFQEARAARDVQAGYLETVVRHVPIPFISVRSDGALSMVNNPARRLTGLQSLRHFDQLAELDAAMPSEMREIEPGSQKLIQTRIRGVPAELRVSVAEITVGDEVERLYSIENLSGELTAREATAWRNLIRVLTHEIMNTLTPITSLAQSTTTLLDDATAKEDIRQAVQTIAKRSKGLMNFVLKYRELLNVPEPAFGTVNVNDLLENLKHFMHSDSGNIEVIVDVQPATLEVSADEGLLNQVLVNLFRNALHAVSNTDERQIVLTGRLQFGRGVIRVCDNGRGIDDEHIDQIFIPFFTTKRDGSGIGLSLCREIMSAHGGEITVDTGREGTTITLVF